MHIVQRRTLGSLLYEHLCVYDFEESFFSWSEKAIAVVLTFTGYFCCNIKTVILNSPNSFQPRLCLGGFIRKLQSLISPRGYHFRTGVPESEETIQLQNVIRIMCSNPVMDWSVFRTLAANLQNLHTSLWYGHSRVLPSKRTAS